MHRPAVFSSIMEQEAAAGGLVAQHVRIGLQAPLSLT
jgi:hypothetical protein